jgi:ribonuclease HI
MELMAAIERLLALSEPCQVEITTDAEYLLQGITKWIVNWKRRQWWFKTRPVRNAGLWMELDHLAAAHQTTWTWTKGHASHEENHRCDRLAQTAARTRTSSGPDRRRHQPMPLELGAGYLPPRPQGHFFDLAGDGEDGEESD